MISTMMPSFPPTVPVHIVMFLINIPDIKVYIVMFLIIYGVKIADKVHIVPDKVLRELVAGVVDGLGN